MPTNSGIATQGLPITMMQPSPATSAIIEVAGKLVRVIAEDKVPQRPTQLDQAQTSLCIRQKEHDQDAERQAIAAGLRTYVVGGSALGVNDRPIYAEVDLIPQSESEARQFWRHFVADDPEFEDPINCTPMSDRRHVYIPAEMSHPRGGFYEALAARTEKSRALFAQFYGFRNPIMCGHCIQTWQRTITAERELVMFPFWGCVSLPGFMNGQCANCIWQDDEGKTGCQYAKYSYMTPTSRHEEQAVASEAYGKSSQPADLTPSTCPRLAGEFPGRWEMYGLRTDRKGRVIVKKAAE